MLDQNKYLKAFSEALNPALRPILIGLEADEILLARWYTAQTAWPQIYLHPEVFGRYLGERIPDDLESAEELKTLRVDELWITCACVAGDPQAMKMLERRYFPLLIKSLRRMNLSSSRIDDVQQQLRSRLYIGSPGRSPTIASYRGRGDLGSWLAVSGVREAVKFLRKERREVTGEDDHLAELTVTDADAELGHSKVHSQSVFRQAFAESIESLPPREKNLLRQHYLDRLTIEQIGSLYGTHRATAARWLASARQHLLDRTRELLRERLRAPVSECESIIRRAQSQADMSFDRLFKVG